MSHAHAHHAGHGHHHHGHAHADTAGGRYALAIGLNLAFVAAEVAAGLYSNSTALLADAGHNLSDVMGLALAGGAAWLATRPGPERRTYGYGKAGVLAALANAVMLVFACGAVGWEAAGRLTASEAVRSEVMMAVAALGVAINLGTALLFLGGRKSDVNERGAFLHMAADAAVSLGVVVAGALIWLTGWPWIDAAVSLLIVAVILIGTWGLLRESLDLALDAAPAGLDVAAVRQALADLPGVGEVHDVHVWNLSPRQTALTAHLVRAEPPTQAFYDDAAALLSHRFNIGHATLQVEPDATADCRRC